MHANRPHHVRLVMGADMRERIFNDSGDCLGVVLPEHEIETDIDADPVGFFRGFLVALVFIVIQACLMTGAFFLGMRWHA